jgi:hypothetical protein
MLNCASPFQEENLPLHLFVIFLFFLHELSKKTSKIFAVMYVE